MFDAVLNAMIVRIRMTENDSESIKIPKALQ